MRKTKSFFENPGRLRAFLFVALLLILGGASKYFGWEIFGPKNIEYLRNIAKENLFLASCIYILATIVGCVLLALPGVSFAIVAGVIFGAWLGTLLCTIAATIGAVASFLAGRYFLKEAIEPMIRKNKYLENLLLEDTDKNAMTMLMITRLLPIFPYNLQNFAYGITDIKLLPFTIYSMIFMLPGTAMFTFGVAGFTERNNRALYFTMATILAVIVFGSSFLLKKRMDGEKRK